MVQILQPFTEQPYIILDLPDKMTGSRLAATESQLCIQANIIRFSVITVSNHSTNPFKDNSNLIIS